MGGVREACRCIWLHTHMNKQSTCVTHIHTHVYILVYICILIGGPTLFPGPTLLPGPPYSRAQPYSQSGPGSKVGPPVNIYASGLRASAPPKGWGQIFGMPISPPQGRNARAYAYISSYACICIRMLVHVCTCMSMYKYVCICMH